MKNYTLLENGFVHTTGLTFEEATEMKERHESFFPDIEWSIS